MTGQFIRTLSGDAAPSGLGFTLVHEHAYFDFAAVTGDAELSFVDEPAILTDLSEAKRLGADALVEVSTHDMGAAPQRVADLCRAAGLQVVKSTGWFRSPSVDAFVVASSPDELATRLIDDIRVGFAGTTLRAGVIGEVGLSRSTPTRAESAALDATAAAAVATGAGVVAHSDDWDNACAILDELTSRGVDRERIMLAHCRTADPAGGLQELAESGVTLAFDQLGHRGRDSIVSVAERIVELFSRGCGTHLTVSADVGRTSRLRSAGGSGYISGVRALLAELAARGIDETALDGLTRSTPGRFLAFSNASSTATATA